MEVWQSLVDCAGLENRKAVKRLRGSNPLTSSCEWSFGRLGVCDGLKIRRTWFDSTRFHNEEINALVAQQLARLSYTQRVAGASPAESTKRWEYSSAGRTSVSKTEGRGFKPFCSRKKEHGVCSSVGRAPECGSRGHGFESHHSPQMLQ